MGRPYLQVYKNQTYNRLDWLNMPDVIFLGDINIDIIASLPAYPTWGGEGVANAIEYHTGGAVFNTSLALANMGVDVGIIGRIGTDPLAAQVISDMDKAGIDRSRIQIDPAVRTGLIYIVVTPDGERTMFSARGANVFTEVREDLSDYFSNARWYHFSGYTLLAHPQHATAISGLESARRYLCRVSMDPGPEPAMRYHKQIREILPKVDVFFPNEQELIILAQSKNFKDAIADILDGGPKAVVVKRGGKGCVIAYDEQHYEIPAFEVQVQDTTGAGDSFNAGVALGRMVGLSWPASGVLGNILGAIACSKKGGGADEINTKRVEEFIIKDQFKPQWAKWQAALEEVLAWLYEPFV